MSLLWCTADTSIPVDKNLSLESITYHRYNRIQKPYQMRAVYKWGEIRVAFVKVELDCVVVFFVLDLVCWRLHHVTPTLSLEFCLYCLGEDMPATVKRNGYSHYIDHLCKIRNKRSMRYHPLITGILYFIVFYFMFVTSFWKSLIYKFFSV